MNSLEGGGKFNLGNSFKKFPAPTGRRIYFNAISSLSRYFDGISAQLLVRHSSAVETSLSLSSSCRAACNER